jgi:putative membrane protein
MISVLPHLNAALNTTSALLAISGYICIRRKQVILHRFFMISAAAFSFLFLISYVIYHAEAGSIRLQKQGWIRPLYFAMLASHTLLAALIVPLVIISLSYALTGKFARHKALARWTLPIWIYVSITGVLIYMILYHG